MFSLRKFFFFLLNISLREQSGNIYRGRSLSASKRRQRWGELLSGWEDWPPAQLSCSQDVRLHSAEVNVNTGPL